MARPHKGTVDYFPHVVNHGKTLLIVENEYGNAGYAFWFKLLELLCQSEGQYYDYGNPASWQFLLVKTNTTEDTATQILELLATVGAVDPTLLKGKILWVQNLVDNLELVYSRRSVGKPHKPVIADNNDTSGGLLLTITTPQGVIADNNYTSGGVIADNNPHTKLNNTKLNNTIVDNSGFLGYMKDLANRYPALDIQSLWQDCQSWYADHNRPMKDAKRALNNWCKREIQIHPSLKGEINGTIEPKQPRRVITYISGGTLEPDAD
jgi:hypothetical protein